MRRINLLIVICIASFAILCFNGSSRVAVEAADFSKVDYMDYVVTASALNVRTGPSTDYDVISVLTNGQQVKVIGHLGDWYAIYEPQTGYVGVVFGQYLALNEQQSEETPAFVSDDPVTGIGEGLEEAPVFNMSQEEQTLLELVNEARREAGVEPLKFDPDLVNVARLKAKDMVDNNYFSHTSATYGTPFDMMKQFNISYRSAGENIAGNRSVEGAFKAWINDEAHKRNLLDASFNYTGIGIVDSETYGKILVQMFIKK